jgi:hypothetical protein
MGGIRLNTQKPGFLPRVLRAVFALASVLAVLTPCGPLMAGDSTDFEFRWIIPPENYRGCLFADGRAWVQRQKGGAWTLYDAEGNVVRDGFEAEELYGYSNGLAPFDTEKRQRGFVDLSGDIVIEPDIAYSQSDYSEGLIRASKSDRDGTKYGYVNIAQEWVIPPRFDRVLGFGDGLGGVKMDGKWGFINRQGEVVIDFQFESVGIFAKGVNVVKSGDLYGLIDKSGRYLREPQFERISFPNSSTTLLGAGKGRKAGFLDLHGNTAIDFKYDFDPRGLAPSFRNGRAVVRTGTDGSRRRLSVIDDRGSVVFEVPDKMFLHWPWYYGDYLPGGRILENGKTESVIFDRNGKIYNISKYVDQYYEKTPFIMGSSGGEVFYIHSDNFDQEDRKLGYFTFITTPKEAH